jgi:pimeloyl-ACP methyl ester carboxylesterase
MLTAPPWLDRKEYPFTSRTFAHRDGNLHYIDEGSGEVLLFVHGTPDWSFGFRHLIKGFRERYRCVAIDHLGFGLSDKPRHADYRVAAHAQRLQAFIEHLGLKDVTLVLTDFGGSIGLQHALQHPVNVKRILLYNTWMWPLNDDKRFAGPARFARSWFGRLLYLRFGFSVNVMMPAGYGDRKKLTRTLHAFYKRALPDARSRIGTYALAKEILDAGAFWAEQWQQVGRLGPIRTMIAWGMKDRFFPADVLERWQQALPHATVRRITSAGHFVHEEAAEELGRALQELLT